MNLANKLIRLQGQIQFLVLHLIGPAEMRHNDLTREQFTTTELDALENQMLDTIGFSREYRRKINVNEVKGQRG